MDRRPLGTSQLSVSRLSLGSWRTFERIPRDDGLAVMQAAREHGINFLDDARYNDETGKAPLPHGYSEVAVRRAVPGRGVGPRRDGRLEQAVVGVLARSGRRGRARRLAGRMRLDYVDLIYANPPPDGLPVPEMVAQVAACSKTARRARGRSSIGRPDSSARRSRRHASRASRNHVPRSCPTASSSETGCRARR